MRMLAGVALIFAANGALASGFQPSEDDRQVQQGRQLLAREYPQVMRHMARQDGFGGPPSPVIARAMLSDAPDVVAEARRLMRVEQTGQGMWLVRFPYVNVAIIETKAGLVLFDSGYASIGPVLVDLIPTLSPKPVSHIIVSHIHVDHAFGWPALKLKRPKAKTVTSALFPAMAAKEVRLGGSIGRLNNQPLVLQPANVDRFPKPDILVSNRKRLIIGGERFDLYAAPGETEEQMWMAMPSRKAIFTADYYQGFLPNAGNGKRVLRHVDEWVAALRDMSAFKPELLMPMHGAPVSGAPSIAKRLDVLAEALNSISEQTVAKLNVGERKDVIAATTEWPQQFAEEPTLSAQYNRPADIARMVALRWTGWWDDIPSHFAAMRFEEEAQEALLLAGGVAAVDRRARALLPHNPKLAARLADWAYFGAPKDTLALQLALDVYMARLGETDMPVQEGLIYFDQAARARARLETLQPAVHQSAN